jgi:hypothetical protein
MVETDPGRVQQALFLRFKLVPTMETFIYDALRHMFKLCGVPHAHVVEHGPIHEPGPDGARI